MNMDRDDIWKERLSVAIGLGLCTLPFVFVVMAILFDARVAFMSVLVAFVVILIVCNAVCRFRSDEEERAKWLNRKQLQ